MFSQYRQRYGAREVAPLEQAQVQVEFQIPKSEYLIENDVDERFGDFADEPGRATQALEKDVRSFERQFGDV